MKKIILTSNSSWTLYKFRGNFIRGLINDGFQVYLISPSDQYIENLQAFGANFLKLSLSRCGLNPFREIGTLFQYFKLIRKIKPDQIISYTVKPIVYASLAARICRVPKIYSVVTGRGYVFLGKGLFRKNLKKLVLLLYKTVFLFCDKVIFLNVEDQALFVDLGLVKKKKTSRIFGEGVDINYFKPNIKRSNVNFNFTVIMVARLLRDKGVYEYIAAARNLKKKYPDISFNLLGSTDLNPSSLNEDDLDFLQKEGVINYLGVVDDVRPYLNKSDLFVLPSYTEAMPIALLEAMSMQLPVIATNIPGCNELINGIGNGSLIPIKDSHALENEIEAMYSLAPNVRREMGRKSRAHVAALYSSEQIYKELAKEILAMD